MRVQKKKERLNCHNSSLERIPPFKGGNTMEAAAFEVDVTPDRFKAATESIVQPHPFLMRPTVNGLFKDCYWRN